MSIEAVYPLRSRDDPVLVIAPHLVYPTREGSDIAIDRRWGALSSHVSHVDIVAARAIVRYQNGKVLDTRPFDNSRRAKWLAALRTILFRSIYTKERFLTRAYTAASRPLLGDGAYQAVIFSYLASAPLAESSHTNVAKKYVLTHNDDTEIYRNMRLSSRNPVQKLVALMSEQWVRRYGNAAANEFTFIHVSETDAYGWHGAIGEHRYYLGKVGCDLPDRLAVDQPPMDTRMVRLLFVGSLSVKMNADAIRHFAEIFRPAFSARRMAVEVRIVGSNPEKAVVSLCNRHGFSLFANVSDRELAEHFAWCDFSLLPFPYSTGTKLKLLDSFSRGVPVLSTAAIGAFDGVGEQEACLVSNDPEEWVAHVDRWKAQGIGENVRNRLVSVARGWSWDAMAEDFYRTELCEQT